MPSIRSMRSPPSRRRWLKHRWPNGPRVMIEFLGSYAQNNPWMADESAGRMTVTERRFFYCPMRRDS